LLQLHRQEVAKRLADAIEKRDVDGLSRAIDDCRRYDVGNTRFTINGAVLHLDAAESLLSILKEQRRRAEDNLTAAMVRHFPSFSFVFGLAAVVTLTSLSRRMTPIHQTLLASLLPLPRPKKRT
jgi:hypothetical protein